MNVQLSDKEMIYLYGNLKKELIKLESGKSKSNSKTDIHLHKSILKNLEEAMPQLSALPF